MGKAVRVVLAAALVMGIAGAVVANAKQKAPKRITGRCHCGHVRYRTQGPIIKCSTCDCRGCQRATGALEAPFVTVPSRAFTITAGEPAEFRSDSKAPCDRRGVWHFCPKCGTQVFWKGHKANEVDIFAGTLDDPSVFRAQE